MAKKKKSPEGKLFAFTALDERCMKNAIRRAKKFMQNFGKGPKPKIIGDEIV